jgi:hypothetical protein
VDSTRAGTFSTPSLACRHFCPYHIRIEACKPEPFVLFAYHKQTDWREIRVFGRRKVRKASGFVVKVVAVTKDGIVAVSSVYPIDVSNATKQRDVHRASMSAPSTIQPTFLRGPLGSTTLRPKIDDPKARSIPTLRHPTTSGLSWQAAFGVASAVGASCGVFLIALGTAVAAALKRRRASRSRQTSEASGTDGSWNGCVIYV